MNKKVPIKLQRNSVIVIKQQQQLKRQEQNQRILQPIAQRSMKSLPRCFTKQNLSYEKKKNRLKQKRSSAKIIHYPTNMHQFWVDSNVVNRFSESLSKQQKKTLHTSYINKNTHQKTKNHEKSKSFKKIEGWPSKYMRIQTQPNLVTSKSYQIQLFRIRCLNNPPQTKIANSIFQFSGDQYKPSIPLFQRVKPNQLK